MKHSSKHNKRGWWALGTVALGLLLVGIGLWTLSWLPRSQQASSEQTQPTAAPSPTALPTWTASPRATPTQLPPTATTAPTPTPEQASGPDEPLELAIVHSNDTWGYNWPCG